MPALVVEFLQPRCSDCCAFSVSMVCLFRNKAFEGNFMAVSTRLVHMLLVHMLVHMSPIVSTCNTCDVGKVCGKRPAHARPANVAQIGQKYRERSLHCLATVHVLCVPRYAERPLRLRTVPSRRIPARLWTSVERTHKGEGAQVSS